MRIIINTKNNPQVDQSLRDYATEKILKYDGMIEEPTVAEIVFTDLRGKRSGKDKMISITMTMPEMKNPMHVEVTTSDFMGSIDLAQERIEQQIKKYKTKKRIGSRFPVKYWAAKMLETAAVGPRRFLRKIKKKSDKL